MGYFGQKGRTQRLPEEVTLPLDRYLATTHPYYWGFYNLPEDQIEVLYHDGAWRIFPLHGLLREMERERKNKE